MKEERRRLGGFPSTKSFVGCKRMLYSGVGGSGCIRDVGRGDGDGSGGNGGLVRAPGCIPPLAMPLSCSLSLPLTHTDTQTHSRTKALLAF